MNLRTSRHNGLSSDPLGWTLAAVVWLALAPVAFPGCGGRHSGGPFAAQPSPPSSPTDTSAVASFAPAPATWADEPARPEGRWVRSPRGVSVWAPMWLQGSLLTTALAEVDSTASQPDAQGRPGIVGVPVGYEVIVQDPGAFSTGASPTGLARGMTDMRSRIWVAFRMRPYESTPLLPALNHELLHVATGDANAGH